MAARLALKVSGVLAATALATLNPIAAFAADTTVAFDTMTGAPGDTVTITLTPGTNGLTDFCSDSTYDNTYNNTDPGFTVEVYLFNSAPSTPTFGIPAGSSEETFTPSTQTSPLILSRTIPLNVVDGTYSLSVTCISPSTQGYSWDTPIPVSNFVVSTTPPPTDPGSGGSSGSGESGGSSGTLPDTGSDDAGSALGASLATAFIALGTVLAVRRRRAA